MNILYPGRGHAGFTNLGNHGDRFSCGWHYQKPWPCRAFKELRMKAAEIADFGFSSHENRIKSCVVHPLLDDLHPLFKFSKLETALWQVAHDQLP